jgi:hypothetical protein
VEPARERPGGNGVGLEAVRPQLRTHVGGDAVEATISHLAFDAALVWLGCPSSTARADSPSIRWGNRPAPATCVLESRSSTRLGSGPRPCLLVTPTMLDDIPCRARILGLSTDPTPVCPVLGLGEAPQRAAAAGLPRTRLTDKGVQARSYGGWSPNGISGLTDPLSI